MKKISLLLALALLTSCSSTPVKVAPAVINVTNCDSITVTDVKTGIDFPCMDGKSTLNFAALKGPLIVNVWGSWCESCKDELPILIDFYTRAASKVKLLGIDVEESNTHAGADFVKTSGITWPNVMDPDGRSRGFFGMGVPVTWFIDATGTVVYKKIGTIKSVQQLEGLTMTHLKISVS